MVLSLQPSTEELSLAGQNISEDYPRRFGTSYARRS
jgi:hypothetical protein